jgi:phthalate 4,5-dioxygenase oxygenase subunit
MLTAENNRVLTETGEGTPMGELFRRFWLPVLLSSELSEPDGNPVKVNVLGEDLVAFRDSTGRVGLVDAYCAHRRSGMYYGRNEESGLRCVYHGWKYDVTGQCVDLPSAPNGETLKDRIRIKAYPTREHGGYLWAYMGPVDDMPPALPRFEYAEVPETHRFVTKRRQFSNWAQIAEGVLDPVHFSYLHVPLDPQDPEWLAVMSKASAGGYADRLRWIMTDRCPPISINPLPHHSGMTVGGKRKADNGAAYWRVIQFLMPSHSLAPTGMPGDTYHGQTIVPIDDRTSWVFSYAWNPERPLTDEERASYQNGSGVHAAVDPEYVPIRNISNEYLIDRKLQREKSYTGIKGITEQDAAVNESMGAIVDRTKENLVQGDIGIAAMRRLWLDSAAKASQGISPLGSLHPEAYHVRPGELVTDSTKDLVDVMRERFGDEFGLVNPSAVRELDIV